MAIKKKHPAHENHERWLVSYADFITLLFAFFVVMFASSQADKGKAKQVSAAVTEALSNGGVAGAKAAVAKVLGGTVDDIGQGSAQMKGPGGAKKSDKEAPADPVVELVPSLKALTADLQEELKAGKLEISLTPRGLVVSLRESAFFPSGGDVVDPKSNATLEKVAKAVNSLQNGVRLEGHTDSIPIHNAQFRSNWELSAARGIAMLNIFADRFSVSRQRMAIVGYADTNPVASNDTPDGRARNRRVDVVILSELGLKATGKPSTEKPSADKPSAEKDEKRQNMPSPSIEFPPSGQATSATGETVDFFVTRQPIFQDAEKVFGYEMLFHSCVDNAAEEFESRFASSLVISNSFFSAGAGKLISGKKAFLSFPADMLVAGVPLLVPRNVVVVQIPDTIEPDPIVLSACGSLRENGYVLALNNFSGQPHLNPLLDFVDIVKVNFQLVQGSDRRNLMDIHRNRGVSLLADKVETQEDFEIARKLGYNYFQGFFFERPKLVAGRELGAFKQNYLRVLAEIHRPDLDYDEIVSLIKRETELSSRLLGYINSAMFSLRGNVSSLQQALALMGEKAVRNWISAAALKKLAKEKPGELVVQSMLRARFCESVARHANFSTQQQPALFQIGMFSLLDAMLDRPLDQLLSGLPVSSNISKVLLGAAPDGDRLAEVLTVVRAYEVADWSAMTAAAGRLGIPNEVMPQLYVESATWSADVCRSTSLA